MDTEKKAAHFEIDKASDNLLEEKKEDNSPLKGTLGLWLMVIA